MEDFNIKKLTALVFVFGAAAVLLLGFLSCRNQETGDEEITVGVVLPLSGSLRSTGERMKNAMELALEEINGSSLVKGTKITFIVEDSAASGDVAKRAYEKLIKNDGVTAVLGPFTSTATKEIISVADENKIVAFSPTSAAKGLSARSDFLFRASLTVERLVPFGIGITRERLGYSNVATITNAADEFSRSNNEEVNEELAKHKNITITSAQFYSRSSGEDLPDLTAGLNDILAADPTPEAIFISALTLGRVGVLVQAQRLGMEIPFLATLITLADIEAANNAEPGSAEGAITFTTWIAAIDTPENRRFLRNYREKYDGEPDAFAALSYASVYILVHAIADASSTDPEAIRDAMADIRVDTLLGEFYFDRNGDAVYEPIVGIVEDGKFEVFGQ